MDIPSGEWFFSLCDVIITSYSKEQAHINSKNLYKDKKILYIENEWQIDSKSKIIGVYTDFFNSNNHRFSNFKNAKLFLVHNSDCVINKDLTNMWLNSNPNITLYSQNLTFEHPRAFVLPIGQANSMWPHGVKTPWLNPIPEKNINILLTYCENTSPLRIQLNNLNNKNITKAPKCNYINYVSYLQRSKFVICPPGNGPDTHRLWETLAARAIPIVIKDDFIEQLLRTFPDIPLISCINYNSIDYDNLKYDFKNFNFINKDFWINKIKILKMKKHFISFATSNFSKTLDRIENEAIDSGFFDIINVFTEKDIPEFMTQHHKFISANPRGFGYWLWKPYIVKKYLSTIPEGDIVVYLDAGCSINKNGKNRFDEYIQMCIKSPFKNISYQYSQYKEYQYTKGDIFQYFKTDINDINSGQLIGGMFMLQKCSFTTELINKWYEICCNYSFIDETISKCPNHPEFISPRNDQSIFSCLRKFLGTHFITNEVDIDLCGEHNLHIFREKLSHIPFWATRIKY